MWAKAVVRKTGRPLLRSTTINFAAATGRPDSLSCASIDENQNRYFSSQSNNNNNKGGRGGQGGNGRGNGNKKGNHGRRPKKTSFSEKFLDPAARGELKNHKSTIPKLTGRRPKGQGVRGADRVRGNDEDFGFAEMEEMDMASVQDFNPSNKKKAPQKKGSIAQNSPIDQLSADEYEQVQKFIKEYNRLMQSEEKELYYWNERDYDTSEEAKRAEVLEKLLAEATRDADGNMEVEVDDETFAMFEGVDPEKSEKKEEAVEQRRQPFSMDDDPVFQFVTEAMGVKDWDKPPPPNYNRVLPLQLQGPTMQDFVESMMNHPSKYGEVRFDAPRAGSDRQPVPDFPPNRKQPPLEFVEANKRFIYVWGLPPLTVDGEAGDLENPLHCLEIQKTVGSLFDVSPEQVSVASTSSAFVGFPLIEDYKFALAVGPMSNKIESTVTISKYEPKETFSLAKEHADSLVLLDNLPLGYSPSVLAESLFPAGSDVGEVYGNLTADKIVMVSPNAAVLAFESAEVAEHALSSSLVQDRLAEAGQHRVRFARARRELVYTGTHGGPDGTDRMRRAGPRLIVDGDTPTKAFFVSHAGALLLRHLDPSVSREEIAEFFQPFCAVPRDALGSVEFVVCRDGLPTGRAYIGFDEVGEAEAALAALANGGGRMEGLGPGAVTARLVKDSNRATVAPPRPDRSEEELLDSLNNWEQYVDPADLKELLEHNISRESLDEALRAIRYHNTTFASMDQALRAESINPDREAGGMYKELVQTYVSTLKECLSTPEDPGPIYESLFFPDEEVDTEIFDREAERQEELKQRREVP